MSVFNWIYALNHKYDSYTLEDYKKEALERVDDQITKWENKIYNHLYPYSEDDFETIKEDNIKRFNNIKSDIEQNIPMLDWYKEFVTIGNYSDTYNRVFNGKIYTNIDEDLYFELFYPPKDILTSYQEVINLIERENLIVYLNDTEKVYSDLTQEEKDWFLNKLKSIFDKYNNEIIIEFG